MNPQSTIQSFRSVQELIRSPDSPLKRALESFERRSLDSSSIKAAPSITSALPLNFAKGYIGSKMAIFEQNAEKMRTIVSLNEKPKIQPCIS